MTVLGSDEEPARLACPGLLEYRFMQAGITPRLTVLYLPDYVTERRRSTLTQALWRELRVQLPGVQVVLLGELWKLAFH